MRQEKMLWPLLLTAVLAACSNGQHAVDAQSPSVSAFTPAPSSSGINQMIDHHTLTFFRAQPILSTTMDVDEALVGGPYNHRLPDYSVGAMQQLQSDMRKAADQLQLLMQTTVQESDRAHLSIVQAIEAYFAGSEAFKAGFIDVWGGHLPYIVNQYNGPLMDIPETMQVQQRIATMKDARDYLSRLQAFSPLTQQILATLKADEQAGVILPASVFPATLLFLENFIADAPAEHTLVSSFAQRMDNAGSFTADEKKQLLDQATTLVRDVVYVGYKKILHFMKDQQTRAPVHDGIWAQPGGESFYRYSIVYRADSTLDSETIHQIGLAQVARISAAMDRIFKSHGYHQGSVAARMQQLKRNPDFLYENSDAGRTRLMADLNQHIARMMRKAPTMFATLPEANVEVRRIPAATEAGKAGAYYTHPSLDGNRPGIFWINLRDITTTTNFGLKTLTYHEAVPGHHFQISLNMAQKNIGLMRQNTTFNAYVEGWALYSEQLAKEMGMYKDDPWGDLGRLQAELFRATRLVVDTGLHAKRWSRKQAIEYFHQTTGTSKAGVIAEVERYIVLPGQALGYKLGMMEFNRLRNLARSQLGEHFDIRKFHDVLLLPGARPMAQVRYDVEQWIKQQHSAHTLN